MINWTVGIVAFLIGGADFGCGDMDCWQGYLGPLVMWILVWLSFIDGQFEYYQLGVYFGTEAHCNKEKAKAEVMVKDAGQAVHCFGVSRN